MVSDADAPVLADGGKSDFRWGEREGSRFDPVTVDRRLKDGDTITLGGVTLTAHLHPGHTRGSTSFTFTVREAGRDYRVIIANMASINAGVTVNGMPKYPTIAADYARTFAAQKTIPVDVFLASHAGQFRLHESTSPATPTIPTASWIPRATGRRWRTWNRGSRRSSRRSAAANKSLADRGDRWSWLAGAWRYGAGAGGRRVAGAARRMAHRARTGAGGGGRRVRAGERADARDHRRHRRGQLRARLRGRWAGNQAGRRQPARRGRAPRSARWPACSSVCLDSWWGRSWAPCSAS